MQRSSAILYPRKARHKPHLERGKNDVAKKENADKYLIRRQGDFLINQQKSQHQYHFPKYGHGYQIGKGIFITALRRA
jgi:hypothetical protein